MVVYYFLVADAGRYYGERWYTYRRLSEFTLFSLTESAWIVPGTMEDEDE